MNIGNMDQRTQDRPDSGRMSGSGIQAAGSQKRWLCRMLLCVGMLFTMTILTVGFSTKAYAVAAGDTGYVNYTYLNLRKSASTSSAIVVKLSKNDPVTIKKVVSSSWYQVSAVHAGKTYSGYVASRYITLNSKKSSETSTADTSAAGTTSSLVGQVGYVNYTYLNLRKSASTKGTLIVKLSKYDQVTVKKVVSSKWYQVSTVHAGKSYNGYVSSQYITLTGKPSASKIVYLTFDDGPGPYTAKLLNVLKKYNAKATFFVTGKYPKYADLITREAKEGHTVGLHSYRHNYDIYTDEATFLADLNSISDLVYKKTGTRSKLIRFTGGSNNTSSKSYCKGIMTTLTQTVASMGYLYTDWNVNGGDAGRFQTTDTAAGVAANVIAGIQKQKASVVLQHDVKSFSVDAVEKILQWGITHGYSFRAMTTSSPMIHLALQN